MIHLDTNVLIGALNRGSSIAGKIRRWLRAGEKLGISAIAWAEFLNGPVTRQHTHDARFMLEDRILPFALSEAEMASKLFNMAGRKRGVQPDCFIAATAICSGALLATQNGRDFLPFAKAGLRLA